MGLKVVDFVIEILVNEDPEWDNAKSKILFEPSNQILFHAMRESGVCEPITVRRRESDLRLVIVSGHERWAIARLLKWHSIPAYVID
jgi:hypothetical protein